MLLIITALFAGTALAQSNAAMDVAAPEPEGCWSDPQFASPAPGAFDAPLDTAPRFYLSGRCQTDVQVTLSVVDGDPLEVVVEQFLQDWSTTVVVTPTALLTADTAYEMVVLTESGSESVLRFDTGETESEGPADVLVTEHFVEGWCNGRERGWSTQISVETEEDGLVGYVTATPNDPFSYQALLATNGFAGLWFNPTLDEDAVQSCLSIATFASDGTLSEWTEDCVDLPAVEPCRRSAFGCAQPATRSSDALLFLPLIGLAWVRRRKG